MNFQKSLLDSAVKHGLIDKRGAWYTRGEEKVGQGKENAVAFIENNPDYKMQLEKDLRQKLFPGQVLRNKEGEVVTEEQIRDYEKAMREKGVGTGSAPTDATPPAAPEAKAPATPAAPAAKESAASKASAKKAADKAVPEELF